MSNLINYNAAMCLVMCNNKNCNEEIIIYDSEYYTINEELKDNDWLLVNINKQ